MLLCGRQVDDPKYIHEMIQAASGKQYNHEIASRFIWIWLWLLC